MDKAVIDAGEQMRIWRQELSRHHQVLKRVEAKPPKEWPTLTAQGHGLVKSLEIGASQLESHYKNLVSQRAEFSAFAHIHPKVFNHDPKWPDAERWAQTNVAATEKFNQSLKRFTQAAHQLNEFWFEHKLFQRRDVTQLAGRLQADSQSWREDYNQLVSHFNTGQTRFAEWQQRQPTHWNAKADSALHPLRRMHHYLATISKLIMDLDSLKESYLSAFAGIKEITSIDPMWERWSTFHKKQQAMESEFTQTKDWYQKAFAELQASTTGLDPLSAGASDQTQSPE